MLKDPVHIRGNPTTSNEPSKVRKEEELEGRKSIVVSTRPFTRCIAPVLQVTAELELQKLEDAELSRSR